MRLTTRCGAAAVDGLNEALPAKATEAKVLRTTLLRADTTVVPGNVSCPTDSGLLAKAIRRIVATGNSVLTVIYHLLSDPDAKFCDLGPGYYESRINKHRRARDLATQLQVLTGQYIAIRDGKAVITDTAD